MLLTKNLIEDVDEELIPMLKMVNIPDYVKCVSIFSGLSMREIDDKEIKKQLVTWANHKLRFFKLLGNKLRIDIPISYKNQRDNIHSEIIDIAHEYPAYALWMQLFTAQRVNKIETNLLSWRDKDALSEFFPDVNFEGLSITHFFKKHLKVPDEVVTKIASIFENDIVNATYTISIDPIEMMLASENPYEWTSCYRLETDNDSSHADGCMAAVLDKVSLISYVWNNEGKMTIYHDYHFKSVRYKRMRQWIEMSPNMVSIHFNEIYPGRSYDEDFNFLLRNEVESLVANYLHIENKWRKTGWDENAEIDRVYRYGYGEFSSSRIWTQSGAEAESIDVYDTPIHCACGCGEQLDGSDSDREYVGQGFHHDCYEEGYYCDLIDDYCTCCGPDGCCEENCCDCDAWRNEHPLCDLTDDECDCPDSDYIYDGRMESNEIHCWNCPHWQECHQPEDEEEE